MITRTCAQLAKMCNATTHQPYVGSVHVAGVTSDSRKVKEGNLFIPLVGDTFDGHDYVAQALSLGASAALWQKSKSVPQELEEKPLLFVEDTLLALQQLASKYREQLGASGLQVVGITGSNGKTTTKDLLAAALSAKYVVHKTAGNLNNHIGLPLTILELHEQTEVVVLEMGMSGFHEIELLSNIGKPDVAIITNIGDAHLLQLGSREGIAKAKLEIVSGLQNHAHARLLLNGAEPLLTSEINRIKQLQPNVTISTFGIEPSNDDWVARNVKLYADHSTFTLNDIPFRIHTPGVHNVSNCVAAIAAAYALGVDLAAQAEAISKAQMSGMRIEPVRARNGAFILSDAYNANPTAVRAALALVAELNGYRRKWVVLADMLELGPDELRLHEEIGRTMSPESVDRLLVYGERAKHIAVGAQAQGVHTQHFQNKERLIEVLQAELHPEDLVLVKGSRGMRMEQVIHALTNSLMGEEASL